MNDPLSRFASRNNAASRAKAKPTEAAAKRPEYAEAGSQLETGKLDLTSTYESWKARPSSSGMAQLLRAAKPVIDRSLSSNAGSVNPALSGRAKLMAISAIESYDPKGGASLNGWISTHLQGLRRYSQAPVPVGVPFQVRVDANKLFAATEDYVGTYGSQPTDDELADLTSIPKKRIAYVRKMSRPVIASSSLLHDEGDDVVDASPAVSTENYEEIWEDFIYNGLDEQTRKIYDMRTGRGEFTGNPMQAKDIAKQLGISAASVSQRLGKVAEMLAEGFQYEDRY